MPTSEIVPCMIKYSNIPGKLKFNNVRSKLQMTAEYTAKCVTNFIQRISQISIYRANFAALCDPQSVNLKISF